MKLAAISYEVDHETERERIAINEYFVIDHLELVAAGEHGFKGATRNLAEGGTAYVHILFAANI